jgi:predicted AAA+ superfamily ATPase
MRITEILYTLMWRISVKDRAGVALSFYRVRQLWYLKLTTPLYLVSY